MSRTRMFLMTIVATVVLGGLMSASASATTGWVVNGTTLSGSASLATSAAVVENTVLTAAGVTITCTGNTLNAVVPRIEASNKASASNLEFTGCSASSPCALTGGNAGGKIGTLPVSAEVEEKSGSSKAVLAHLSPKTGTMFATIAFTGGSCALAGKQPVSGKALVEGPTGQEEKKEQEIKAITTEASGLLKVGSSAASLAGVATLALVAGEPWAFAGGPAPLLEYLPKILNFGLVPLGESKTLSDTVMALRETTFGKGSLDQEGAAFSIVSNTCSEKTLKAGETCTVTIKFTPTEMRLYLFQFLAEAKGPNGEGGGELDDEGSE